MPVGRAPHRTIDQDPGAEVRFTMCEYATSADARFAVSRLEIDKEGLSYTVETLQAIRSQHPDDELFLILGGDQAMALPEWHEPSAVLGLAVVAAVERDEHRREAIAERVRSISGNDERVEFFTMPRVDVSSTLVRARMTTVLRPVM